MCIVLMCKICVEPVLSIFTSSMLKKRQMLFYETSQNIDQTYVVLKVQTMPSVPLCLQLNNMKSDCQTVKSVKSSENLGWGSEWILLCTRETSF